MPSSHFDVKEMRKRGDVDGLIHVLETGDVKDKREAAFSLGELRSNKSVKQLIGLLEKEDVMVRANAAWALGEIGDVSAVLPLIDLLSDLSQIVQLHAAWSLGRLGDSRAIPELFASMKNGTGEFRKVAKDAIAMIEERKGYPLKKGIDDKIENLEKFENPGDERPSKFIDIGSFLDDYLTDTRSSPGQSILTLNVLQDHECNYAAVGEKGIKLPGAGVFEVSKDILLKDTGTGLSRKIVISMNDEFSGLVSIDIILRYLDNTGGQMGSLWLQMSPSAKTLNKLQTGARTAAIDKDRIMEKQIADVLLKKEEEKLKFDADTAARILGNIGMSGIAGAASTITSLSGKEGDTGHLRTIPVDQLHDEITGTGDSIAVIEFGIHIKSKTGDMNGNVFVFILQETGLAAANELLCVPPEALIREFNADIISALTETANILVGQYVSAISEFIQVPISMDAPVFKMGTSMKIAGAVTEGARGKIEFALSTDIDFGKKRTGRMILLLDQRCFDMIMSKLF